MRWTLDQSVRALRSYPSLRAPWCVPRKEGRCWLEGVVGNQSLLQLDRGSREVVLNPHLAL